MADVAASRSDDSSSSPFPCPPFNLKCVTWHNTRQIPLPLWGHTHEKYDFFFPFYGDSWKTGPVTPRVTRCWLHWAPLSFHLNAFAVFVPQNSFSIIHRVIRWFPQDSGQLTAFTKICYSVHLFCSMLRQLHLEAALHCFVFCKLTTTQTSYYFSAIHYFSQGPWEMAIQLRIIYKIGNFSPWHYHFSLKYKG